MNDSYALFGVMASQWRKSVQLLFFTVTFGLSGVVANGEEGNGLGPFRTQAIELKAGWNAVYLEVDPLENDPNLLFEETPIEIVTSYFRPVSTQQFVENPSEVLKNPEGWNVWYRPGRADELLTDIYEIQAHTSYLIYTKEDYNWMLEGVPFYGTTQWHPNAYSLVGFPIDSAQAPTVENFFAGVSAHAELKVYKLVSGNWNLITDAAGTLMEAGVAYWTYAKGDSEFSGPLQIDFSTESFGGLIYREDSNAQEIVLKNVTPYPQEITVSLVAGKTGLIPLSLGILKINGEEQPIDRVSLPFGDSIEIKALEAGESFLLGLEVRQMEVNVPLMASSLAVSTDAGVRIEIPLVSIRQDLLE